jgi:hypothetical protein
MFAGAKDEVFKEIDVKCDTSAYADIEKDWWN